MNVYNLVKLYLSLIPKSNSSESGLLLPLRFYGLPVFKNFVVHIWIRMAPLFRSVLNQVKTYSKVLFPALVVKLNE